MKIIYPGTFDPITKGHLNVIERASALFESVEVAIGIDSQKPLTLFSQDQRLKFLELVTSEFKNVSVSAFDGLLTTFAQERKGDAILRSLRNFSDYEYEKTLAETNKNISGIETVFLFPDPEYQSISSTLLREIAERGESLSPFIPEAIEKEVSEILQAAR